jgi:(+)-trans-carveol dehydrogenase
VDRFDGKVVFVSGAARGQGRAHALGFAQEGADVIAVDACADHAGLGYPMASEDDLHETVRLVEETGQRIVAGKADVRSQAQLDEVVAEGMASFGRIDVILANAGVLTMAENSWEMTEDEWNTVVDINLSGAWRTCKAGIPAMVDGGRGGAIIITATSNGYRAEQGHASYNAAKLGLVGLMHTLAGELGHHNIRVNTVHPSIVRTPLIWNDVVVPLMFPGQTTATMDEDDFYRQIEFLHEVPGVMQPSDVTEVMKFLASDAGRFTTGTEVLIDGGYVHKVFDYKKF